MLQIWCVLTMNTGTDFYTLAKYSMFKVPMSRGSSTVLDCYLLQSAVRAVAANCGCVFRSDAWLTKGIAGYLSCLFQKKTFGNNEYRYMIAQVSFPSQKLFCFCVVQVPLAQLLEFKRCKVSCHICVSCKSKCLMRFSMITFLCSVQSEKPGLLHTVNSVPGL